MAGAMKDVRCPENESRLFFQIDPSGIIEVACRDCRQKERRTDPHVVLVLHRYTDRGQFRNTQVLRLETRTKVQLGT